jgi:sirohydrochlorin ferrochelatase
MSMTLVACSHGTADPAGAAAVTRLVDAVRRRAGLPVVEAHVDVHPPYLADVAPRHRDVVVVPLLLAAGYHAHVDIARVVDDHPRAAQADALGPDPRITALLLDRLHAAGLRPDDTVVLAAAGSSDDAADVSVRRTAEALGAHLDRRVTVAYGAARTPRVADEVARLRAEQPRRRVVLASYLLATGHFHRRLLAAGADVVTAPLLDGPVVDERLVDVVLDRYAVTARSRCTAGRRHAATRERPRSGGR